MTILKESAADKRKREMQERLERARIASDGKNGEASHLKITTVSGLAGGKERSSYSAKTESRKEGSQEMIFPSYRGRIDGDRRPKIHTILGPISKQMVEFRLAEVDPKLCKAHPANRRNQKFLTETNPKVAELLQNILESGGVREAAKAVKNSSGQYELLDGSTRRVALMFANEMMKDQAIQALYRDGIEVESLPQAEKMEKILDYFDQVNYCPLLPVLIASEISPEDSAGFARTANEMRSNESPWELSQAIQGYKDRYPSEEHTQQSLAKALGVSRDKVKRAMTYEGIPESLMLKFNSPDSLSESVAKHLLKTITKTPQLTGGFDEIINNVNADGGVYTSATQFKRDFDAYVASLTSKPESTEISRRYTFNASAKCEATITRHRTNPNQFKIDLQRVAPDKLKELEAFLNEWVK